MNKINKINPIAKLLRDKKYGNKIIDNKKKKKLDKIMDKELSDAKTAENR